MRKKKKKGYASFLPPHGKKGNAVPKGEREKEKRQMTARKFSSCRRKRREGVREERRRREVRRFPRPCSC